MASRSAQPAPLFRLAGALIPTLALIVMGCSPGIQWRLGTFDEVHAEAVAAGRLTFVYFRNWYSVDCTRFEEEVLKDPSILAATADMVCVPLEQSYSEDAALARDWRLARTPAIAIVDPAGSVYEAVAGPVTVDELLAIIQRAKERFAGHRFQGFSGDRTGRPARRPAATSVRLRNRRSPVRQTQAAAPP